MKTVNRCFVNLGVVLVAAGLAYLAYQGFYNRYWSDDWCYNRDFKNLGILKTIGLYFATGEEAIRGWPLNRYSMTALSGLVYLPGVFGTQIFTAITIMLWLTAIYWVLLNLVKLNNLDVPKSILFLLSGFILYYTLYISPDRFQILYWRSGVIPYSFAIIFGLFLLGLITHQALRQEISKANIILTVIAGLIGGGFSEIGCAFLFGGMTLLLMAAWRRKRLKKDWAVNSFSTIQSAWAALLITFIVLIAAPSNSPRYNSMQEGPNNLLLVPFFSTRSALFFITHSIKDLPIPHLVLVAFFISLSMLAYTDIQNKLEIKQAIWLILIAAIVTFLLIITIQAPTTYLYSAPPDPRGQSLSRFTLIVGLAFIAWVLGGITARHTPTKLIFIPILFILLGYGYTARAISITYQEHAGFVQRAQIWDERDQVMREAEAQGISRMEVTVIDTHEIGTKDIMRSQDMNRWVRSCAASYYGMEAIKAKGTK